MKILLSKIYNPIKGPLIFWTATMVANVFNWLYNISAGRNLEKEDFAILSVYLSMQYILHVPASALSTTVTRFSAIYFEKGESQKHFYFFRQYWWLTWVLGIGITALFFIFQDPISHFFGIKAPFLTAIFSLTLVPLFLLAFERGALSGQLAFGWIGLLVIIEAVVKFVFLIFSDVLPFAPLTLAIGALPIAMFTAWFASLLVARSFHPMPVKLQKEASEDIFNTYKFLSHSFFATLGVALIYSVDVLMVKHFMTSSEAGIYATLSILGKVLYFGLGSMVGLIIPLVARQIAKGNDGKKPFMVLFSLVLFAGTASLLFYHFLPHLSTYLLLKERGFVAIPYLTQYSAAMFLLVLTFCISSYNLVQKKYLQSRLIILAAIIEAGAIIVNHNSIGEIVNNVFLIMLGLFSVVFALELVNFIPSPIRNNLHSFRELFRGAKLTAGRTRNLRVLVFNWRDLRHVRSGGAEVYIHEISKRLVEKGVDVTLFTANDQKSPKNEVVDGVSIMRRGGFITVYLWAFLYYALKFRGKFDLIIDSENGVPFYSPLYAKIPVVLLVHHVHQDIFFSSLVPPFSWIANFMEGVLMPNVYKNSKVVSVSKSTSEELEDELGITTDAIISNGVDIKSFGALTKTPEPTIIYLGRFKKYKSIEVLLYAFEKILKDFPAAKLIIAGDGEVKNSLFAGQGNYRSELEHITKELRIENRVRFLGKVSEDNKRALLATSWVMVHPSSQEGWGITCLEANASFTPVIASNVAGLKDAVSEGESGYLFEYGNSNQLSLKLKEVLKDESLRLNLNHSSRTWSEKFSWDIQAKKFEDLINTVTDQALTKKSLTWTIPGNAYTQSSKNKMLSFIRKDFKYGN